MALNKARLYQLHRLAAPIMVLPLLLTLITGSLYQIADLGGNGDAYDWLLDLHKGNFGSLSLDRIYPFLNALGLLTLVVTGSLMWFKLSRRSNPRGGS